jgi:alkane 1-monooxygenase
MLIVLSDVGAILLTMRSLFTFAIASLTPAACLAVACLWGGIWPALSVFSITVMVFILDKLTGDDWAAPSTIGGHALSALIGLTHFALLAVCVWALATVNTLSLLDKILIFTAGGLWMGQVSNSNAHELIHRTHQTPRRLGVAIYATLLFGHHASAHPKVHHVHAATDKDPNSARLGEGVYRFFWRAWTGGFVAGYRAENMIRARSSVQKTPLSHPYLGYVLGAIATLVAAYALAQTAGVIALIGIAAYAQFQLFLSDYVQHYGLRRQILADGRAEPIGPRHSWNAPHWYSSAMMLNAPRHSDHHMHPSRSFPELELRPDTMPMLPHSVPVMACIALLPPLWKHIMNPRVAEWMPTEKPTSARDISPAVLAAARQGGLGGHDVPIWAHEKANDDDTDTLRDPVDSEQRTNLG